MRMGALVEVAPAVPVRIGHHGLPAEFVEGDVLRRVARAAGDRQRREHPLGIGRGPLQRLHAAHRAADNAEQRVDAEAVEQHGLRPHHVRNGDDRKIQSPHFAGRGIGRGRAGRAHAAADHVGADDEILVGVERAAGTDHDFPPARLAGQRMHIGDVLIERQRMADQDGVGTLGIELAIGLVGDLERRQIDAAIELQRLIDAERRHQRTRMVRLVRSFLGMDRRAWYRLHVCHLGTSLLGGGILEQKSGHKKPGLNKGSAGITSVPGLFSELFNVAASRPAQMTTEWAKASPKRAFRQGRPMVNPAGRPHGEEAPLRRLEP